MYYLSLSSVPSQVLICAISNTEYFSNEQMNGTLLFIGAKKQDPEILSFSELLKTLGSEPRTPRLLLAPLH